MTMEPAVEHDVVAVDEFDALDYPAIPDRYPAKLHARKVAAELKAKGESLIFLEGEPSRTFEDSDMGPTFRQRRYFYYLSGANFADCAVTYEVARDRLILWIPYVEPRQVLWFGHTPGIAECLRKFDVDDVRYTNQLDRFVYDHLPEKSTLYVIHRNQTPDSAKLRHELGDTYVDWTSLQPAIDQARVIKTDYEVDMIRKANAVSAAAHRRVAERLLSLENEAQIDAIFQAYCTAAGAKDQAYAIIAGSGPNAGTLHYDANNEDLYERDVVVLDAGCEWHCYASDITRTLPIPGRFSDEAGAIHAVVQRMQDECIEMIRPGTLFFDLHIHASRVAQEGLMRLGVLSGDPEAIWEAGTVAAFFPHGLGHHVGLEVHDVTGRERLLLFNEVRGGRNVAKREMVTAEMMSVMAVLTPTARAAASVPPPYKGRQHLQKNMIVTVEPGVYFCKEYIEGYFLNNPRHAKFISKSALEKYYRVGGVRIEDDILVTDDGYENLSSGAPKGEELLKVINGEA
ncbi:metallopeptidase family M24 [Colletotrichum karsti]|uniref:Xaa-Pro aminopeptidase n=1 Tax=Colletotrichum karsti TaxID=1095194 RepID=A0A9P6LGN4_9PEZI|nr:metallopeptidase family M24 [Colletotrichum karsti]KAF9872713.1 metallopeptidase family M24 [Colletotrichum karsti]